MSVSRACCAVQVDRGDFVDAPDWEAAEAALALIAEEEATLEELLSSLSYGAAPDVSLKNESHEVQVGHIEEVTAAPPPSPALLFCLSVAPQLTPTSP